MSFKKNNSFQPTEKLKYRQLTEFITQLVEEGGLSLNDRLPSVQTLANQLKMSRETIFKGLNILSEKGVIESVYRKGYFLRKTNLNHQYRIFFMLDKLTAFKEQLYNSFTENIRQFAEVDIYFHEHNYHLFEKLITQNLHNYTHFVITTFLREDVSSILNKIRPDRRIIVDYLETGLEGPYSCIYQDFENNIYNALSQALPLVHKYQHLNLVLPDYIYQGPLVKKGFLRFCDEHAFNHIITKSVEEEQFRMKTLFITTNRYETDDVNIIKMIHKKGWQLGKEVGLISYNDSLVKEVLEGGITTISTDFVEMGRLAAAAILENKIEKIATSCHLIIRKSL